MHVPRHESRRAPSLLATCGTLHLHTPAACLVLLLLPERAAHTSPVPGRIGPGLPVLPGPIPYPGAGPAEHKFRWSHELYSAAVLDSSHPACACCVSDPPIRELPHADPLPSPAA